MTLILISIFYCCDTFYRIHSPRAKSEKKDKRVHASSSSSSKLWPWPQTSLPTDFIHKLSLNTFMNVLSMAARAPLWQRWGATTEILWSTKPKMYYLALYRRSLLTSALDYSWEQWQHCVHRCSLAHSTQWSYPIIISQVEKYNSISDHHCRGSALHATRGVDTCKFPGGDILYIITLLCVSSKEPEAHGFSGTGYRIITSGLEYGWKAWEDLSGWSWPTWGHKCLG